MKEQDLDELSIVSSSEIMEKNIPGDAFREESFNKLGVKVFQANGKKCERCWKTDQNILNTVCDRCLEVVNN